MDRLTSIDASFLSNESATSHMHIGAVMIFEGAPPRYDDLVAHIDSRLHLVPRYRQKLATPPAETGRPFWVDDPHFNITYHVRHASLPAPGGEDQLRRRVARVFSQRLDRRKPLWELWLAHEGCHSSNPRASWKRSNGSGFRFVMSGVTMFSCTPLNHSSCFLKMDRPFPSSADFAGSVGLAVSEISWMETKPQGVGVRSTKLLSTDNASSGACLISSTSLVRTSSSLMAASQRRGRLTCQAPAPAGARAR